MKDFIYYNNLYDIYSELLTEKEKSTFQDYYQEDFSLSEIADYNQISRSAVQKTLKNVLEKLNNYENKLQINSKNNKLKEILSLTDNENIKSIINEIIGS